MKQSAVGLVVSVLMLVLGACGAGQPAPAPTSTADRSEAAAAFEQAHAAFKDEYAAAVAIARKKGLSKATESVRAVRAAYFGLDAATREIDMPPEVLGDVNAMLSAIGDLIAALDLQGAASTAEAFRAADARAGETQGQADDAIEMVLRALGSEQAHQGPATNGSTTQRRLSPSYVSGDTIADASAWVDDLLAVGAVHANHLTPAEDMGVVIAWRAAFPVVLTDERVVGDDTRAPKNGISGFSVLPKDDAKSPGRTNPYVLAFAVRDDSGACAAGVLMGYPDPSETQVVPLERGAPCTGRSAAAAAVH